MKIAFAPFSVARLRRGLVSGRERGLIERIDIADIEDGAAPPRPALLHRLCHQIEITGPGEKAGEGCGFTAMFDFKSERQIKSHGTPHVVRGKRNGADRFDHNGTSTGEKELRCHL